MEKLPKEIVVYLSNWLSLGDVLCLRAASTKMRALTEQRRLWKLMYRWYLPKEVAFLNFTDLWNDTEAISELRKNMAIQYFEMTSLWTDTQEFHEELTYLSIVQLTHESGKVLLQLDSYVGSDLYQEFFFGYYVVDWNAFFETKYRRIPKYLNWKITKYASVYGTPHEKSSFQPSSTLISFAATEKPFERFQYELNVVVNLQRNGHIKTLSFCGFEGKSFDLDVPPSRSDARKIKEKIEADFDLFHMLCPT